jgi:hypothetical protein
MAALRLRASPYRTASGRVQRSTPPGPVDADVLPAATAWDWKHEGKLVELGRSAV